MREDCHSFNKEYPISLRFIQKIIDRVANRYPRLSKDQIAIIIKMFFTILRSSLFFEQDSIILAKLFNNLQFLKFKRHNKDAIKIKLATPKSLKFL